MLKQPLLENLTRLRLPGFREGLKEQWENPHYADLAFEERLGLLVDLECTRRDNSSLKRRTKAARFVLPASIEDLDLSPVRGLDRSFILELAQGEWIRRHLNILVLGPTGAGKTYLACLCPARVRTRPGRLQTRLLGALPPHFSPAARAHALPRRRILPKAPDQPGTRAAADPRRLAARSAQCISGA